MTTPQLNRLTMYRSLRDYLAGQTGLLAIIEILPALVEEFNRYVEAIEQGALRQISVTAGKTDLKVDAGEKLLGTMILVIDSLRAYAKRNNLIETMAKVSIEKWYLNQLRDSELSTQAVLILDVAAAHLPAVARYGITEVLIRNFRDAIATYSKALDSREGSIADRKVTRSDLHSLFVKTDGLLNDELDAMIEHFRESHPSFCDNYFALRDTKALGMRRHKTEDASVPASPAPASPGLINPAAERA